MSSCKCIPLSADGGDPRYPGRGLSQSSSGSQGQSLLGSSTGPAGSLITLALLSGDTATAQTLIRQALLMGDIMDVSNALAAAASNVSPEWDKMPPRRSAYFAQKGTSFATEATLALVLIGTSRCLQGNSFTAAQALTNAVQNGAPSNAAAQAVSQVKTHE